MNMQQDEPVYWHGPEITGIDHHFADPAVEQAFMREMLPENRRRMMRVAAAAAAISCINIAADILAHRHQPALLLSYALPRCLVLLTAIGALLLARRVRTPREAELLAIAGAIGWAIGRVVALHSADTAVYSGSAMIIGSIALLYFGLPIRLTIQVPLMAALSAIMMGTYILAKPDRGPTIVSLIVWLCVLQLIAISSLRSMRRTIRRGYAQGIALRHLALHDPLTSLPNRRHFETRLASEWSRAARAGTPLSLITLDIDHFKPFNDSLGHATGDSCLRDIGFILPGCLTRPGDLPARTGGEEFACLLPDTDQDAALLIAARIEAAIRGAEIPHPASPVAPHLTVSLGVATAHPGPGQHPDDLFARSDELLYAAKNSGRNRIAAGVLRPAGGGVTVGSK